MAIAIVQSVPNVTTTGNTVPITFSATPTLGNWLIAVCSGISGSGWTCPSWSLAVNELSACTAILFIQSDGSTSSFTFTQTGAAGDANNVYAMEVSGLSASSPLDQHNSGTNVSGTTATLSASATSAASELWVGVVTLRISAASSPSATNGWTVQNNQGGSGSTRSVSQIAVTDIVSAAGTPSTSVTWSPLSTIVSWCVATFSGANVPVTGVTFATAPQVMMWR